MPLRSVEAASRDDAIAAAREQFGPSARIVGVRRVRSGGVLGFFATERYVAEVDPDHPSRAAGRDRENARTSAVQAAERADAARRAEADAVREVAREARAAERVSELAGLLASEAPEPVLPTYSRASVTRPTEAAPAADEPAPFDAAWFEAFRAESARTAAERAMASRSSARLEAPRSSAFRSEPAPFQPARVESAPVGSVRRRGGAVTPAPWSSAAVAFDGTHAAAGEDDDSDAPSSGESPPPSPFTAALARMVSGDRDVRQAVQAALDDRDAERSAEENARPGAGHQEEESVTEQGAGSPSEVVSRREEAIAEVLRTALERGHSDEALADILRRVLANTAAQVPLPEEPQPLWEQAAPDDEPWDEVTDGLERTADAPIWAEIVLHDPAVEKAEAEKAATEARAAEEAAAAARAAEEAAAAERAAEEAAEAQRAAEEAAARRAAEEAAAEEAAREASVEEERAAITTVGTLARTASDPAPFPLDVTSVMPALSLLPPLPGSGRRGGLPPVPPAASRPAASASTRTAAAPADVPPAPAQPAAGPDTLATVVRLPVAPVDTEAEVVETPPAVPAAPESLPTQAPAPIALPAPVPAPPAARVTGGPAELVARLRSLGIPDLLLGPAFVADVEEHGTYAALVRALGIGLPAAPVVPEGAGEVLFVVGPGVDTLRAARSLAASLRLDPERVQWATRGELAGLAPRSMTTIEAAVDRRTQALAAGTLTIVAVDAPMRTDAYWMAQMLAVWTPVAVWAVVDATRKPEDVGPWVDGLPRVDALMVQDTDLSADPAAVLDRIAVPVALLDGAPATPHRWASLLCERLEKLQA